MATSKIHAPTLSNFSSELRRRNIARGNLYYVQLTAPQQTQYDRFGKVENGPTLYGETDERLVSTWCAGASTPLTYMHTQNNYNEAGIKRSFAHDYQYGNLSLHFYVDQDYVTKKFFDDWMRKIVPNKRNFKYPKDYTIDKLSLFIINMEDTVTYQYDYRRVFPIAVSDINLSATSGTEASVFTVHFTFETYDYIAHGATGAQTSSLPDAIQSAYVLNTGISNANNLPITPTQFD